MTVSYPRLATFPPGGYDKGRGAHWLAIWFAVQHLFFKKWWFPRRLRPTVLRAFGAEIGTGVVIRHGVRVTWPWKLAIGDDSWIGEDSWIYNVEPIRIGSDVCLSQGAFLCSGSHDHRSSDFRCDNGPITIENGAWIAADALVLRGTVVGEGSVVAARAVVRQDVPAGTVVHIGTVY
ncbi:WcaF family extracellular polysaccharide biosynthesis acetyltransferase [Nocardioides caeni]|uniref:WcaF family extracellular polysaccharide biosynthesis acetyltransferase n=1 Tax=Nocardioides caeni TaxID=574700 RepID=UPI001930EEF3|nr:WcaF family extracellular polysaccharide biosynthesis acetyltransferase [Nocardioides caeni]